MSDCLDAYWDEAVESAFEDAGIDATREQIEQVAGDMRVSAEQQGMATGHDVASLNVSAQRESRIQSLEQQLRESQDAVEDAKRDTRQKLLEGRVLLTNRQFDQLREKAGLGPYYG